MNTIKQHIKQNQYNLVYLLYGTEGYLKKLYRDKLKTGILDGSDEMNYSYFEGKSTDVVKVKDMAETMPFFSDRRLIIIEDSGWFKTASGFEEYIKILPETTNIVFVESEVDKRGKLFKAVKAGGYVCEMNGMEDKNIRLFAASQFNKAGILITEADLAYFITMTGNDMYNIVNEAEKLICYALESGKVTVDDINSICTEQIYNKIFQMIDEIAMKKPRQALSFYYDLIALREKPLSILFLIIRHFNILLRVKDLAVYENDKKIIAEKAEVPPFTVPKYMRQAVSFNREQIIDYIKTGINIEEMIKTGRLNENIGIELILSI